jgi:hypothetical protein
MESSFNFIIYIIGVYCWLVISIKCFHKQLLSAPKSRQTGTHRNLRVILVPVTWERKEEGADLPKFSGLRASLKEFVTERDHGLEQVRLQSLRRLVGQLDTDLP